MTYSLEAGKEGKRLSHGCNCKEGRQHTNWRWRGRVIGQIMVGTVKRAGTTYFLEMERKSKRSDHSCNWKRGRD
jgi:hypothetical protein